MEFIKVFAFIILILTFENIAGSDASRFQQRRLQPTRQKRFQSTTCTFSTFNTNCRFTCFEKGVYLVCFTVTLKNIAIPEIADVEIKGSANGFQVFWERIGRQSDPNPPPQCSIKICMVIYDAEPEKLSACIKLNDEETNVTLADVGCFRTSLFDKPTTKPNRGETTLAITSHGLATGGGTRSTTDPRTSFGLCRSNSDRDCTTQSSNETTTQDGRDTNGSGRIGIPLSLSMLTMMMLVNVV